MASIFLINWEARLYSESEAGRGRWKRLKLKAKPNKALVNVTDPGLKLTQRSVKCIFPFYIFSQRCKMLQSRILFIFLHGHQIILLLST